MAQLLSTTVTGNLTVSGSISNPSGNVNVSSTTVTGNLAVSGIVSSGNLSAANTTITGNLSVSGTITSPTGNVNVSSALFVANTSANANLQNIVSWTAQFNANTNNFSQISVQNQSIGANASADFVAHADDGSDLLYYIDLGINGSQYNDPAYSIIGKHDGYLYNSGGNLAIGTTTGGVANDLVFFANGTTLSREAIRVFGANNIVNISNILRANTMWMPSTNNLLVASPPANTLSVYAESFANRILLSQKGPSGLDVPLQSSLARQRVGIWAPPGNATTAPLAFGIPAPVSSRTALARNVTTANTFTRTRRLAYDSNASVGGAVANYRSGAAQFTLGDGLGNGGFFYVHRFGFSNATPAGSNTFIGLNANIAAPTAFAANTVNCAGLGTIPTSNYFHIMYGGSVAQPAINLGASFWYNTSNTDLWEFTLYSPNSGLSNTANTILYYRLEKIGTTNIISGSVEAGPTVLPANTTLLGLQNWRDPGTQGTSCAIDLVSLYIETDD